MREYPSMTSTARIEVDIPIRSLKSANVYLINTGDHSILVDTGMDRTALPKILPVLDEKMPDYIFLTHMHIDHIGNSMEIRKRYGSRIIIGSGDYTRIQHIQKEPDFFRSMLSQLFDESGVPKSISEGITSSHSLIENLKSYEEFRSDIRVEGSLMIQKGVVIVSNPGHSPGSSSLLLADEDSIFTGDHILPGITPNISFYDYETDSLGDYLNSLKKTSELGLNMVYPGHREPFAGLKERCDAIKNHHLRRFDEVCKILEKPSTAYKVAIGMRWSRDRTLDSMNPTEQNFAIGEAITHLVYLERTGKIEKREKNGVFLYHSI
jgi:glyoxylase-like metal-dependent hydrolase (beta-lactamase superfamily II)